MHFCKENLKASDFERSNLESVDELLLAKECAVFTIVAVSDSYLLL